MDTGLKILVILRKYSYQIMSNYLQHDSQFTVALADREQILQEMHEFKNPKIPTMKKNSHLY